MPTKPRQSVTFLPVEVVVPHPRNVRDDIGDVREMAASIREHGILQPLVVTEHPTRPKAFLLLAGHRRRAAAVLAGQTRVPCIIRHGISNDDSLHTALMLVENGQRRQLTPMEKARAIGSLLDTGLNQTEVGRLIGLTPSSVNTFALLLELDDETAERVEAGDITASDAREAVREARAKSRRSNGAPTRGRPVVVEPAHFTIHHRLAEQVKAACTHSTRPLVGSIACGQCWEAQILATAGHAESDEAGGGADMKPSRRNTPRVDVDEVAVERRISGDATVELNYLERREAVRQLAPKGLSDAQIAERIGITDNGVQRIRERQGIPSTWTQEGIA